jgi:hypothetical protein
VDRPGKFAEDSRAGTRCLANVLFGDDSVWSCSLQRAHIIDGLKGRVCFHSSRSVQNKRTLDTYISSTSSLVYVMLLAFEPAIINTIIYQPLPEGRSQPLRRTMLLFSNHAPAA